MKSEHTLYARIESTVWEALEENDLYMKLSAREKLTSELLKIVQGQQAEAWDEGHSASETTWKHIYDGHPVPEGEMCPECSTGNPYRKEADA